MQIMVRFIFEHMLILRHMRRAIFSIKSASAYKKAAAAQARDYEASWAGFAEGLHHYAITGVF